MNPRFLAHRRAPRAELLEPLSDEELAELIAQGHEEAFEALVTRHRRVLVNHCSQLVGRADAEEAVQEALLRAYLSLSRGQSVQRVSAWLRTIAHNTALNLLRARGARPIAASQEPSHVAGDPFERREQLRLVLEALGSLPQRQREALVMRELEGRSYAEIESRLRTSNGAVRQLLNRARARVRTRLGTLAGLEPVLRWIAGNGSAGSSALRLGALGGGCAVTVKLCAGALLPVALGPAPLTGAAAARPMQHVHTPTASARLVSAAVSGSPAAAVAVGDEARPVMVSHAGTVYIAYRPPVAPLRSPGGGGARRSPFGGRAGTPSLPGRGQPSTTSGQGQSWGGGQPEGTSGNSWGSGGQTSGGQGGYGRRQHAPRGYAASGQTAQGSGGTWSEGHGSGSTGDTGTGDSTPTSAGAPDNAAAAQHTYDSPQWPATSSPGGTSSSGGSPTGDSRSNDGPLSSSGEPENLSSTTP